MGDIFEDIAERVATARTRALMGERKEALALLQRARMDYLRFREVLHQYPGSLALAHSIEVAQSALSDERSHEREQAEKPEPQAPGDSSRAA